MVFILETKHLDFKWTIKDKKKKRQLKAFIVLIHSFSHRFPIKEKKKHDKKWCKSREGIAACEERERGGNRTEVILPEGQTKDCMHPTTTPFWYTQTTAAHFVPDSMQMSRPLWSHFEKSQMQNEMELRNVRAESMWHPDETATVDRTIHFYTHTSYKRETTITISIIAPPPLRKHTMPNI